jgi:hypothetical protein
MTEYLNEPKTYWSCDSEYYNAETLYDLIDGNDHLEEGSIVQYGEAQPITIDDLVDASDITEMIEERAWELVGDIADGFPDLDKEQIAEIDTFLKQWAEKHLKIGFYKIVNSKDYKITFQDMESHND